MTDDDLLALITDEVNQPVTLWSLLDLQVISLHFSLASLLCLDSGKTLSTVACELFAIKVAVMLSMRWWHGCTLRAVSLQEVD